MSNQQPDLAIFVRNLVGGGAERVIINLAKGLAEQGIKIDLVLSRAEGELLTQVSPKVRLVDLKAAELDKRRAFKLPTSFTATSSIPKLARYLRQEQPKTLLSACHYANEVAILAKHLARVKTKVIVSEHTTLSVEVQQAQKFSARLFPLTARLFYPWADGIIAVSHGVAADIAKITHVPGERIQVIYNPVITPELEAKSQAKVDHPWFAAGEPPVILGVGRLVAQKDFPTLIKAFAQVQKGMSARLMILGNGRDRQLLLNLVKELNLEDKVAFPGFVENPYSYMASSAVFVLSSAWEGLPTVLIEAMAVGTPVVSTDCESGPREILAEGKYGELASVGDTQALAGAILRVLAGQTKIVDSNWLEQFRLDTSLQQYLELFTYI